MMTKSKWSAALLLAATFVLGALVGGAAVASADRGARPWRGPDGGMIEHLTAELDLDATQQDSIQAILERSHQAFELARDEVSAEIRAQLSEEQVERYEAMKREMGKHYGHRRGGPPQPSTPKTDDQ